MIEGVARRGSKPKLPKIAGLCDYMDIVCALSSRMFPEVFDLAYPPPTVLLQERHHFPKRIAMLRLSPQAERDNTCVTVM